jgi:hypothetical protein
MTAVITCTLVIVMTRLIILTLFATGALAQQAGMRSVYILPMTGGLDQYLAGQITRDHVMQVVADPKIADVILTDRLNEAFGDTLAKLHPREDDPDTTEQIVHHSFRSSSNKGTIFLVDAKSREVIWSDYENPGRNASAARLNRAAGRIVKKLAGTLGK